MNKEITIKECCTLFTDGDWIESKDQSDSGIRLIQTGNIGNGVYLEKKGRAKYISEETMLRLGCTEVYPGDILVSRLPDPVGRACMIPPKNERMITAVDCSILRINDEIVDKRYLLCFLNSPCYYKQITSFLAGTTRIRISRKNLERIIVKLPVREKQLEIAKRIDLLTSIINLQIKTLNKLDELIKSRFVEMFGDLEINPMNWAVETIDNISIFLKSGLSRKLSDEDIGIPVIRSGNIQNGAFYPADIKYWYKDDPQGANTKDYILDDGDILINFINSVSQIGKAAIFRSIGRDCIYTTNLFRMKLADNCNEYYFNWFAMSDYYFRQIQSIIQPAVNQASFTTGNFLKLNIPLPPMEKQLHFATFVKEVDKSKLAVKQSIEKLETLKKSLMQECFG